MLAINTYDRRLRTFLPFVYNRTKNNTGPNITTKLVKNNIGCVPRKPQLTETDEL